MSQPKDAYDVKARAVIDAIKESHEWPEDVKTVATALRQAAQEADKAGYERGRGEAFREAAITAESDAGTLTEGCGSHLSMMALAKHYRTKARLTPVQAKDAYRVVVDPVLPIVNVIAAPEPSAKPCDLCGGTGRKAIKRPTVEIDLPCPKCRKETK